MNVIFDVLERLASQGDILVQEVIAFTLCEAIVDKGKLLALTADLGPTIRGLCEELQQAKKRSGTALAK